MDANSEARLAEVHPELSRRVHQLSNMVSFPFLVTQGARTYAQQMTFWQQGRNPDGSYIDPIHHTGVVTNAKGEQSAHCFLYAVDVAPTDGFKIDWNGKDAKWQEILDKAKTCGLAEGAQWRTFPDEPHLYLQELPATPDTEMVQALREGGLDAVKTLIDGRLNT